MTRRKCLLEPTAALVGVRFLDTLAYLHITAEHPKAKEIGDDFQVNKQVVARMTPFKCEHYGDLPSDAKSFVSKCAGIRGAYKKKNQRITMQKIVMEQYALVQYQSAVLYKDVMGILHAAADKIIFERNRLALTEAWYEQARKSPLHSYHPDDMPEEVLHTNAHAWRSPSM